MLSRIGERMTLCDRMAGFLKALGFESKPEYMEKIPDQLGAEHFCIHDVSTVANTRTSFAGPVIRQYTRVLCTQRRLYNNGVHCRIATCTCIKLMVGIRELHVAGHSALEAATHQCSCLLS